VTHGLHHGVIGHGLVGHGLVGHGVVGHGRLLGRTVHTGGLVAAAPALHHGHFMGVGAIHHAVAAPAFAVAAPAVHAVHAAPVGLAHFGLRAAHVGHVGHVQQHVGPITAAIETRRHHQVIDVPTSQDVIQPQTLIIEPNVLPVNIEFRSQSSPVNVNQVHIPGRPGQHQATQSEDEPDRLTHEVIKPVIQEIRETIVPFRRITQEVLPVQEEINTVVARGQRQQVIAQPQVVAQPIVAAQRLAVAAQPALAVAHPVAVAQPAIAVAHVAQPAFGFVGAPAFARVAVDAPAFAHGVHGGLITTGISRFGGLVHNGGIIRARS